MASTDATAQVVTVHCELGNCRRCRGLVVSLLAPTGQPCTHHCHQQQPDRQPTQAGEAA